VLRVTENGLTYALQLDPGENYAGASFKAYSDGNGGTDIALAAGFDAYAYPGTDVMSSIWNSTNLGGVGYYLAPTPDRVNATWMGNRQALADQGWTVAPIYVGTEEWFGQSADGFGSEHKRPPSAATGVTDGNQAVAELQAEGFAAGTTVYLDIEADRAGGGTNGINSPNKLAPNGPTNGEQELSYIVSWCKTVAAAGYNPAIYCLRAAYGPIWADLTAAGVNNVPFWIAAWNYPPNTTSAPLPDPPPSGSGVANATVWQYKNATQITYSGGALNNVDLDSFGPPPPTVIIDSGTTQDVPPGQELDNPDVQPGGTLDDSGTVVDGSVGGTLNVLPGGTADPVSIASGGKEVVSAGGVDIAALILGGEQDVFGAASGVEVVAGSQVVEAGGVASGTIVDSGGVETVLSGAAASGAVVASGGTLVVLSGGAASGVDDNGGTDVVLGVASATAVGGVEVVLSGGVAAGSIVDSGGVEVVVSSGSATNLVVHSGGTDVVVGGGTEIDTTLNSGGLDIIASAGTGLLLSGHTESGVIVTGSGSVLLVLSGAMESGSIITSNGVDLLDGGVGSGTIVTSGGVEVEVGGGAASGSIIVSGGVEVVTGGGSAHGVIIGVSGVDVVVGGATQTGAIVQSGGVDVVVSGAASGAVVDSGGIEVVQSGSVDSAVTISGGFFEVQSGGSTGSGAVTFAGSGGLLALDASASFGGLVAGFAASDHLDLKDIAFGSGTSVNFVQANGSGTLTVSDGVHTANIELLGQYATGAFTKASDGGTGTLIGVQPPAAAAEGLASPAQRH
jgi:autotransporter passenger strand-loop-strand repeat protein